MSIFNKYRLVIMVVTLVGLVSASVYSLVKPPYYDTSIAFAINRTNRQETAEYQYDGYYAIQAADLFSQTVMSWLMTPSVLLEIYQKAQIDPQISSLEELSARFKTKKFSPQNIVVRFRERDQATALKIGTAITATIEEKAVKSDQAADQQSLFQVQGTPPVTVERRPSLPLNALLGLVAGFIVSLLAAYLIEYQRRGDTR
ncbi:MAG: hypothetical protein V1916_02730 [Patescibacteria group bacterium]